jgi:hypothetical protein
MTPDQEKLLAALAVLEDRIRDAYVARHAIGAQYREVVKSLADPGRALDSGEPRPSQEQREIPTTQWSAQSKAGGSGRLVDRRRRKRDLGGQGHR